MITTEEIESIGLYQDPNQPWKFTDMEDIEYHQNTGKLFATDCTGEIEDELVAITKNFEDLKQIIWDSFPYLRRHLNLN